jgi:hypothetical protein
LKESLKLFSPQTFQKSPSSSSIKRRSIEKIKKERKRSLEKKGKEEKLQKSLSFEKGVFNILIGEHFQNISV